MNYTNDNKLEKLEKKVQDLERKLEEKTSKQEATREMEARLAGYQDFVRSDKGEIMLKKNAYIKNRRGIFDWAENVLALGFNNTDRGRLNQIQIGIDRDNEGNFIKETNTISLVSKRNEEANIKDGDGDFSNGAIAVRSLGKKDDDYGGFFCGERKSLVGDVDGTISVLHGSKRNGIAGIGNIAPQEGDNRVRIALHTMEDIEKGGLYGQHLRHYVDLLPSTLGGITPALGRKDFSYKELVLKSPDGSSWAVRVNNSGTLSTTKL